MGRVPKRKTQKAPPVDKLLKPAAGVAIAMMGEQVGLVGGLRGGYARRA